MKVKGHLVGMLRAAAVAAVAVRAEMHGTDRDPDAAERLGGGGGSRDFGDGGISNLAHRGGRDLAARDGEIDASSDDGSSILPSSDRGTTRETGKIVRRQRQTRGKSGKAPKPAKARKSGKYQKADKLADLPWDDLRSRLSPDTVLLTDTGLQDYLEQCRSVFSLPDTDKDKSHYSLLDQPSGLCMNQFFCGFQNCNPYGLDETVEEKWTSMKGGVEIDEALTNPKINLPNIVLFPTVAGDVYAAVSFAMEHGIEISIKNSGHHYQGASSKANTLHLNMNHYAHYASELGGLNECTEGEELDDTLENQPCLLALARGKEAHLRAGGGENWDKLYRAVKAWNEENGYKYHTVGGGAGTVSPMGWSMQGGLSGTTNGRTLGFGVDQILQVEMVLPLGYHVRFGPTEWETVEGFDVPKTTKVQGVCNFNPAAPESEWVWEPCADDSIDFDGLWFAVCGGGGGNYGVVTSFQLQLSEYLPLETVLIGHRILAGCGSLAHPEDLYSPLSIASMAFVIEFFLNPSSIPGVTDEMSDQCGAPAWRPGIVLVHCYGSGSVQLLVASWKQYLSDHNQTLVDAGVLPSAIESASVCYDDKIKFSTDYAETILQVEGPFAGLSDTNDLSYTSTAEFYGNVLVPREWLLRNEENKAFAAARMLNVSAYLAFGGGAATAHDQANSFSNSHRQAGLMLFESFADNDDFWLKKVPDMYDLSGPNYPGIYGSNHQGPNSYGPLKSNFTKPCPLDLTEPEREATCISRQEAIWGTERLTRLEAIKEAVDPNHMLNCNACVGNKAFPQDSGEGGEGADTTTIQEEIYEGFPKGAKGGKRGL